MAFPIPISVPDFRIWANLNLPKSTTRISPIGKPPATSAGSVNRNGAMTCSKHAPKPSKPSALTMPSSNRPPSKLHPCACTTSSTNSMPSTSPSQSNTSPKPILVSSPLCRALPGSPPLPEISRCLSQALTEVQKLKDPHRRLTDSEPLAIVHKVDEILGLRSPDQDK